MSTRGKALADAVASIFGIDGRWIFDATIDPHEATIWRGVEDSKGRPALFMASDGTVTDVCRVVERFDMRADPERTGADLRDFQASGVVRGANEGEKA